MRSFYQDRLGTNTGKVEETGVFIAAMIILIQGAFAGLMSQVRVGAKQTTDAFTTDAVSLSVFVKTVDHRLPRQARDKRTKRRSPA